MKKAKLLSIFGGLLSICALCVPAAADVPPATTNPAAPAATPPAEAQIQFANKGGIWSWRVVDDKTVLIQSRGRQWYKATLIGNCINLSFANELAFIPNPSGSFDKFSTIRTRGQRCPLVSLVETAPPPKKTKQPVAQTPAPTTTLTSP